MPSQMLNHALIQNTFSAFSPNCFKLTVYVFPENKTLALEGRGIFVPTTVKLQMQSRKYVYRTADSEHSFDLSGLISTVGVTNIYSRQNIPEKEFFA